MALAKQHPQSTVAPAASAGVKAFSLRTNFSWTFAGNIVYAAAQWGMLTVLAKLGSPEMVGQFALGLAITAPIIMFANLQLRGVQATDARQEYEFNDYLGLRLITTIVALMVIGGVVLFSSYRLDTKLVVLIVGLTKVWDSLSDIMYGLLQRHERMDRIAISMMLQGTLQLVSLATVVALTGNLVWAVLALAMTSATVTIGYDIRSAKFIQQHVANQHPTRSKLQPRFHLPTLLRLVKLALPLGIVMLLISLNTNIPRYFIERMLGERELGIFAALSYVMVAGTTVVAALGQSATPRLSKYYAAGNVAAFRALLAKLVGLGALLGAVGVLIVVIAGRPLLTLLYRPEYAEYSNVFTLIMIASGIGFVSSFLGYGMTAARYFKAQAPLFALSIISTASVCFFLVPTYKLFGAALALVVTAVCQTVGSASVLLHAVHTCATHNIEKQ